MNVGVTSYALEGEAQAKPKAVLLLITAACNLKCKYCYETHKKNLLMEEATAKQIIANELSRANDTAIEFIYMGGEPLLAFGLIRTVSTWAWCNFPNNRFYFSLRTNGTLLTKEIAEWLLANKERINVGLSLDGIQIVQYKNRGTLNGEININFFVKNWPSMIIKATIFKDTVDTLYDSVVFFHKNGYHAHFSLGEGFVWDEMAVNVLASEYDKIIDYAIKHPEWKDWDGVFTMKPEQFYVNASSSALPYCGLSNGITAYWMTGEKYSCHMMTPMVLGDDLSSKFLNYNMPNKINIDVECRNCPIIQQCKNCVAMNIKIMGAIEKSAAYRTTCAAQKTLARASALLFLARLQNILERGDVDIDEKVKIGQKCLRLLKDFPRPQGVSNEAK